MINVNCSWSNVSNEHSDHGLCELFLIECEQWAFRSWFMWIVLDRMWAMSIQIMVYVNCSWSNVSNEPSDHDLCELFLIECEQWAFRSWLMWIVLDIYYLIIFNYKKMTNIFVHNNIIDESNWIECYWNVKTYYAYISRLFSFHCWNDINANYLNCTL